MPDNPTAVVGPFFLERTYRVSVLRVYNVYFNQSKKHRLAILWETQKRDLGIDPEWRVKCLQCPAPPSAARQVTNTEVFATRERALSWLAKHRAGAHRQ